MEFKEGLELIKEKCNKGACTPDYDCPLNCEVCLIKDRKPWAWNIDKIEKCVFALKEQNHTTLKQPCDMVNHPAHYTQGGIECIDAIKAAVTGLTGMEAVCTGNVIRYIWRWKFKNGLEDLKKCRWYIDKLIEEVEGAKG